jgi:hypothetical protein
MLEWLEVMIFGCYLNVRWLLSGVILAFTSVPVDEASDSNGEDVPNLWRISRAKSFFNRLHVG